MNPSNCTNFEEVFEADPDISGVGVLCGFFATACLVFIFSIVKSILDHLISVYEEPSPKLTRWSLAFRQTIISFADQQVVTGMSVIIAATFQVNKGISASHWEAVVNLAWFSSLTHLITLTALRDDIHNHRIQNTTTRLRIIGMSILGILQVFSFYPIGFLLVDDYLPGDIPVWCLYHPELEWKSYDSTTPTHKYNWGYVVLGYIGLFYGFTTRIIFLKKGKWNVQPPRFFTHILNPVRLLENGMTKLESLHNGGKFSGFRRIGRRLGYNMIRANHAVLISSIDLYQSTLWETTWIFAALVWGTIRIFLTSGVLIQDEWKFGQVVPIVLLILPVVAFVETLSSYPNSRIINSRSPKRPLSVIIGYPNPFRQENFTAHISNKTPARAKLYQSHWYRKLVFLQYGLSLVIVSDLLWVFPVGGGPIALSSKSSAYRLIGSYLMYVAIDVVILLTSTLLCLDRDLGRYFPSSLPKHGAGAVSFLMEFLFFGAVMAGTVYLEVFIVPLSF